MATNLCVKKILSVRWVSQPVRSVKVAAAAPRIAGEASCNRRKALQVGLQISGFVGFLSAFPTVGPAHAGVGADETEEVTEKIIPELEEDIENAGVPTADKPFVEEELESIEENAGKVEEDITEGASEQVVEAEANGLLDQVEAFKNLLGL